MLIDFGISEEKLQQAFNHLGEELLKIKGLEKINGFGILDLIE